MSERATSWDLDDTVIAREGITRGLGIVKSAVRRQQLLTLHRAELPRLDRTPVDVPLALTERISYAVHAQRQVFPWVRSLLEVTRSRDMDHYGNTGRSNKRAWVDMSYRTLEQGGVAHLFEDVFFTPEGTPTAVSKAAGIRDLLVQYDEVNHVEDDPRTAVFLAGLFPEVTVYLVQYGTTGLLYSHAEVSSFPNIRRVGVVDDLLAMRHPPQRFT